RKRYEHLSDPAPELQSLPPVTKQELMENFDEWVTDPAVAQDGVERFVGDRTRIGTRYLGSYIVFATSGTSGRPAVFVHDRGAATVYLALAVVRRFLPLLSLRTLRTCLRMGCRTASIVATGGHFTSSVIGGLARQRFPRLSEGNRTLSLLAPIPHLVRELNRFRAAILGSYPTAMSVLSGEQEAGTLRIAPALVLTGAEWLSPANREKISSAFRCPVRDTYAASEFMGIAYDCDRGRLHLNADWLVLEPVDKGYRPVPPGRASYTTLLTNLANRVQPIVRYDLGDSVTEIPGQCPCGSPLPPIQVEGRKDEILHFRSSSGIKVPLLPMVLATVVEETPGVGSYQLLQTGPAHLSIRLEAAPGHDRTRTGHGIADRLREFLSAQGLEEIVVEVTEERPVRDPAGGKLRQIFADI
ncbi:MAG: phenylacetate--CoA ligase family protein, partial [Thermodesulfobacteriota bacterium]|nr:phenylacetate--CoA ligase family protein [Thermodesulfobacteriota bacterium]